MRTLIVLAGFICLLKPPVIEAQVGADFPAIEVENLQGQNLHLPDMAKGSYALYGLATTAKAEDQLRSWQVPVYNTFIAKTGLMDQLWDVQVYFIPVFTGGARAAKASVVKKLKANNERLVTDHLLIYAGEGSALDVLQMGDKKEPHFYLVDEQGRVVWMRSGAFRQKYLDEITGILSS